MAMGILPIQPQEHFIHPKGALNASVYKYFLVNWLLPPLRQLVGEGPHNVCLHMFVHIVYTGKNN